jgi:hypothetical protein
MVGEVIEMTDPAVLVVRRPVTGAEHAEASVERVVLPRTAYRLSIAFGVLAAAAAASTFVFGGMLTGPAVMNGSCRGTALAMLVIAVPTLAVAMAFAARGSTAAVVVWLGMTWHLTYNTVLLLLGESMNRLFLLYELTLALGLASAIAVLTGTDASALAGRFASALRTHRFAMYLWVIAGLNVVAWLGRIVPAVIDDTVPSLLDGTGTSVVPTYAQDLAFWLPLISVAAWWLWERRPIGLLLGGAALAFWAIEGVTVAVDQWFGHRSDPASTVASGGAVIPFALSSVVGVIVLWRFLAHARGDGVS